MLLLPENHDEIEEDRIRCVLVGITLPARVAGHYIGSEQLDDPDDSEQHEHSGLWR